MRSVALGEFFPEANPNINPAQFTDEEFELFSIPAYDAGNPERLTGSEIGSTKKAVQPGDILLSRIVPHIRRAWVVTRPQGVRQIASSEWIILRDKSLVPEYVRHFLLSDPFHSQFMKTVAGVGGSLLRARSEGVGQIEIPLPSVDEQRRLAAILDEADDLRRLRQKSIERLNDLGQSIFNEMFGDVVSNDMEWEEIGGLGEFADIVSGITKGRKLNGKAMREVPYMAVVNVQDRHLRLEPLKTIEASEEEIDRYRLQRNDLLLTEGGDPDKLGRGTLWNDELPECIHQNHVFRVRLFSDRVDPVFLNWLVGSQRGKKYFLKSAKQTTGIASINMTQLRAFPLLAPPVDQQRSFHSRVSTIELLKGKYLRSFQKLDSSFSSLQQRAFGGEL